MIEHLYVLTGASRGLGLAMATQLLQPGQRLLTLSRQRNDELQARADATGVVLEQWSADLGAPADVVLVDTTPSAEAALLLPVDVIEDSTGITLYADMPGVPKDRLQLRVEGDQLNLEGEMVLAVPAGWAAAHALCSLRIVPVAPCVGCWNGAVAL